VLQRSIDAFAASPRVDQVVVVAPPEFSAPDALTLAPVVTKPCRVVAGGARRQDSVAIGFDAVADQADIIVVHDAARPLVSADLIVRTIEAAVESGAAIAAIPARDTVKRASGDGRFVTDTLPRETVFLAQTPQAFRRDVLRAAVDLGRRGVEATDEAALAAQAGHPVRLVEGDPRNIKITDPDDLAVARAFTGEISGVRVGTGYDLHRLAEGGRLVLAGIEVPFEKGPVAHSDGDVVCHAVTDAILGAAAAGDIGQHFPDTDARWMDARGLDLLGRAVAVVRERGYRVANVDVVVILERPKLGPHVVEIRRQVAEVLGVGVDAVSVKGKTNEGIDAVGRGEAIAAHAVALLDRVG
jgi:2-C-methyl-D-erythritol 4-phosphate cytidylyltransferase/2-C-methyl-D-erythritol 2,4-cyclodiphosphate synthase